MTVNIAMPSMIDKNPFMFEAAEFAQAARVVVDHLHDMLGFSIDHEVERVGLPELPDEPPEEIQEATYELVYDLIYSLPTADNQMLTRGVTRIVEMWGSLQSAKAA
jgi:hypothetical protein